MSRTLLPLCLLALQWAAAAEEEEAVPPERQCAACTWVHRKLQTEYSKLIYSKDPHGTRVSKAFDNWCEGIRFVSREDVPDDEGTLTKRYGKKKQLKSGKAKDSEIVSGIEIDRELAEYCDHYKRKHEKEAQAGFYKIGHLGKASDFKIVEELCKKECGFKDEPEASKQQKAADDCTEGSCAASAPTDEEIEGMRVKEIRSFLKKHGVDAQDVGTDKTDLVSGAKRLAARIRSGEAIVEQEEVEEPVPFTGKWTPRNQCAVCTYVHSKLQSDYAKTAYSKERRPVRVQKSVDGWCRGITGINRASDKDTAEVVGYGSADRLRRAHGDATLTSGDEVDAEARMYCYEYKRRNEKKALEGFRKVERAAQFPIVEQLCKQECGERKTTTDSGPKRMSKEEWRTMKKNKRAEQKVPTDDELSKWRVRQLKAFLNEAGVDAELVGADKSDLLREAKRIADGLRNA